MRARLRGSELCSLMLVAALGSCGDVDDEECDPAVAECTTPGPCAAGAWDDDDDPSTACTAWTVCAAGEYEVRGGSAVADRVCAACAAGTFSAGQGAACVAWSTCAPGTSVSAVGSAGADRTCAPCGTGSFSTEENAAACMPWSTCRIDEAEATAGSPTLDRTCALAPWTRQFGSSGADQAQSIAIDGDGNIFVSGQTAGALPGQTSSGGVDAFVRKYDAAGAELWTRQFGTAGAELNISVAVDSGGNAIVVGRTDGAFSGHTNAGLADVFVRKYSAAGAEQWTEQFGTASIDYGFGVAVDTADAILVAGYTQGGTLPDQVSAGGTDAYVRKYTPAGVAVWTRQFGSVGSDVANAVTVDLSNNVFVVGRTSEALPGQVNAGPASTLDAYVRKYDASGAEQWTRQFGSIANDIAWAAAADGAGRLVVVGYASDALPAKAGQGGEDAFVRTYDAGGEEVWTRQFGTAGNEHALGVAIDGDASIVVTGFTTGALGAAASAGGDDAFARKYDASGTALWTQQVGTSAAERFTDAVTDARGNVVLAGTTSGALTGQTSLGSTDALALKRAP